VLFVFTKVYANSGREIIDESDVFVDVHKAIRRMAPAPRTRAPKGAVVMDVSRKGSEQIVFDAASINETTGRTASLSEATNDTQRPSTFIMRSSSTGGRPRESPLRSNDPELLQHLKHLGPSNAANRPKQTRINTVKIKPAPASGPTPDIPNTIPEYSRPPSQGVLAHESHAPEGGIGAGLLSSAAGEASDGVHTLSVGYGTMAPSGDRMSWKSGRSGLKQAGDESTSPRTVAVDERTETNGDGDGNGTAKPRRNSVSTIGSLRSARSRSRSPPKKRHTARSGSISENVIDVNGIKKIVLETTSSSDSDDKAILAQSDGALDSSVHSGKQDEAHSELDSPNPGGKSGGSKKKRKKRGKKKKGGDSHESEPLLNKH
jgi:metal transporter CNNM